MFQTYCILTRVLNHVNVDQKSMETSKKQLEKGKTCARVVRNIIETCLGIASKEIKDFNPSLDQIRISKSTKNLLIIYLFMCVAFFCIHCDDRRASSTFVDNLWSFEARENHFLLSLRCSYGIRLEHTSYTTWLTMEIDRFMYTCKTQQPIHHRRYENSRELINFIIAHVF